MGDTDDDLELDRDVGEATIVYETPEGEVDDWTVPNEHIAYFQDHWIIKTGEDEEGRDLVRRIPAERVYHVERTVEEFKEEVKTIRDQVQSFASELRTKIPGGGESGRGGDGEEGSAVDPIDIDIDDGSDGSN